MSKNWLLIAGASFAAALCVPPFAMAATFTLSGPETHDVAVLPLENPHGEVLQRYFIRLEGDIKDGDAETLDRIITRDILKIEDSDASEDYEPIGDGQIVLSLNSGGGSMTAGIELSRMIRKRMIATLVEANAKCLSACAVAFMAGYELLEESDPQRMRYVQWPARLGFHRPFIDQSLKLDASMITGLSEKEAVETVAMIQTIFDNQFNEAFKTANDKIQDMLDIDPESWNTDLLGRMLRETGRDRFVELTTVGDALDWDIRIVNTKPMPEGTAAFRRTLFWLCYNSVPITEAEGRGWPPGDGLDDLGDAFFDGPDALWMTDHGVVDGATRYTVTMEELNGTGCEIRYSTGADGTGFAEVDGVFYPFSEGIARLHGHMRTAPLADVSD